MGTLCNNGDDEVDDDDDHQITTMMYARTVHLSCRLIHAFEQDGTRCRNLDCICDSDLCSVDSVVEHWQQTVPTSADTVMMSETECHISMVDADTDIDMSEIKAENERKLAVMTEDEILDKQKELLSALG